MGRKTVVKNKLADMGTSFKNRLSDLADDLSPIAEKARMQLAEQVALSAAAQQRSEPASDSASEPELALDAAPEAKRALAPVVIDLGDGGDGALDALTLAVEDLAPTKAAAGKPKLAPTPPPPRTTACCGWFNHKKARK